MGSLEKENGILSLNPLSSPSGLTQDCSSPERGVEQNTGTFLNTVTSTYNSPVREVVGKLLATPSTLMVVLPFVEQLDYTLRRSLHSHPHQNQK